MRPGDSVDQYLDERARIAAEAWPRPWKADTHMFTTLHDADGESVAHGAATGDLDVTEENLAAIVDAVNELPRLVAAVRGVRALCDQWDRELNLSLPRTEGLVSDEAFKARTVIESALSMPPRGWPK